MFRHAVELLLDLLLPKTDLGVLIQVIVTGLIFALVLWRLWAKSELRLLVIGLGLFVFGLIGLRALH